MHQLKGVHWLVPAMPGKHSKRKRVTRRSNKPKGDKDWRPRRTVMQLL
jgi:hypothetical protein